MPTESQLRDAVLRAFIRQRIEDGLLPVALSKTIAVSHGSGSKCPACDQPITVEHIEYQAFGPRYGAALRLHWGCHVLWQLECVERVRKQPQGIRKEARAGAKDEPKADDPDDNLARSFYRAAASTC